MKYELNRLGPDKFEKLIQSLMKGIEPSTIICGNGPDGLREFFIHNASFALDEKNKAWGYTVGQAKFKDSDGKENEWTWLRRNLKSELEGFKTRLDKSEKIPTTYMFFTNLVLTPKEDNGLRDKAESFVKDYKSIIPNILVFGADDIRTMLENNRDVASSYAEFLLPGDVLSEMYELIVNPNTYQDKEEKKTVFAKDITIGSKNPVNHYLGRDDDIKAVISILQHNKEIGKKNTVWIHGMGGIGKTQFCRQLYISLKSKYSYIGWITFQDDFKQSLVGGLNDIEKTGDLGADYANALNYLNQFGSQLLLFIDNYDNPDNSIGDIERLQCDLIITSRRVNPDTFVGYRMKFFTLTDCKELFRQFYTIEDNFSMNEIIHKTGYLPLAVELIAKTGQKLGICLNEYLELLNQRGFDLNTVVNSNWDNKGDGINQALSKHFGIVFDLTRINRNPEAIYILKNMALFPYLGASQQDIITWLGLNNEVNQLHELVEWGWLQKTSELEFLMHPIISDTVKREANPSFLDCEKLIEALSEIVRIEEGSNYLKVFEYLPYVISVSKYFIRNGNNEQYQLLVLYLRIVDVKRLNGEYTEAYEWGKQINKYLKDQETIEAYRLKDILYNAMSEICLDMRDRNKECLRWAQLALDIDRQHKGVIHDIDLSTTYHNLACAYIQLGDNKNAIEWEERTERLREKYYSRDDAKMLNVYRNMAMIYRRMGELEKAYSYQKHVIESLEKKYKDDPNHPALPVAYNLYSFILRDLGRIEEAIYFQERAVDIRESNNDEDPKLAINYNNLGMIYLQAGKLEEAAHWEKKAINMDIKARGENHPDVASDYYNYAKILEAAGNYINALEYLNLSEKIEIESGSNRQRELAEIREMSGHIRSMINQT